MSTIAIIKECAHYVANRLQTKYPEAAYRTLLASKLREEGIECIEELTLPVIVDDILITTRRIDIWIPSGGIILELKHVANRTITMNHPYLQQLKHYMELQEGAVQGLIILFKKEEGFPLKADLPCEQTPLYNYIHN